MSTGKRDCTSPMSFSTPEIPICPHKPDPHVHDNILALLRRNRLWTHPEVLVVLVAEHHYRNQTPAVFFIINQHSPAIVTHMHTTHETAGPVVAVRHAILVLQHERNINFVIEERPRDGVSMAHQESEDFVCLCGTGKPADLRYLAAEDLGTVFARHHDLRPSDQGGKESVKLLGFLQYYPLWTVASKAVTKATKCGSFTLSFRSRRWWASKRSDPCNGF